MALEIIKKKIETNSKPLLEQVSKMKNSEVVIQEVTVEQCIGGMRSIKGMLTETSELDPMEGIRYRGKPLKEVCSILPTAPGGEAALPEGALWLLLTGDVPSKDEVGSLTKELHARSTIPPAVMKTIDNLPKDMHPMTQLSIGLLALQPTSKFAKGYSSGTMNKKQYWEYTLDDALSMIAQIPIIAAKIYRRSFKDDKLPEYRKDLDWAGNYANMLGVTGNDSAKFADAIRLYLTLHADHEGGPVSSHTTHCVGSALSDPYYSWAAGVCGLAGPLHGLANQECLIWLENTMKEMGNQEYTVANVTAFAKKTLGEGKVIPGFGHAVLRNTDPRYVLEHEFAKKNMPNDPTFKLADACLHAIPPVLQELGKVKNPWPNVDALSGTIMKYYGLGEADYYTVIFAVSRCLGVMAQLVWARLFGLPIERPKSVTVDVLAKAVAKAPPKAKL